MTLIYPIQDPAVLIGSKDATTKVPTGATLTDYYDFDGDTTKIIETGEASKIELNCIWTAGTGETANTLQLIIDASSDRTNWYRILNDTVSGGTSTVTQREFTITQVTDYGTLGYDGLDAAFTAGLLITGGTSGATGYIESDTEIVADTSGTLLLSNVSATAFQNDEDFTDSSTGDATVNGILTSITKFSLPIDISNLYTRISVKEGGVASNAGTIFVESVVCTR